MHLICRKLLTNACLTYLRNYSKFSYKVACIHICDWLRENPPFTHLISEYLTRSNLSLI